MPNRQLIEQYYAQKLTLAEIGRKTGISRQRVHQILRNYKNFGYDNRQGIYNSAWNDICQNCFNKPSKNLHHIDGDNFNDKTYNLVALCLDCHNEAHRRLRDKVKVVYICSTCNKTLIRKKNIANPVCDRCSSYSKRHKKDETKKYLRKHEKLPNCKDCWESFEIVKHQGFNLCVKCYTKRRTKIGKQKGIV